MRPPAWCAKYIGLPFLEKGRGPDGYDCWGLVREVLAAEFGVDGLPDYVNAYSRTTDKLSVSGAVQAGLSRGWRKAAEPKPGTLVILRIAGRPWHCAIAVNKDWFMHILFGANACLERFDSMVWSDRIEGFYERG